MNGIHEVTGSIPVWSTILRSPAVLSELRMASHPHRELSTPPAKDAHHSAEGATVGLT